MFNTMKLRRSIPEQSLIQEGGEMVVLVVDIEALEDLEARRMVELIDIHHTTSDDQDWMVESKDC